MERFVIIVKGWKPLTIITKRSILNVAAALDPSLKLEKKAWFESSLLSLLRHSYLPTVLVLNQLGLPSPGIFFQDGSMPRISSKTELMLKTYLSVQEDSTSICAFTHIKKGS